MISERETLDCIMRGKAKLIQKKSGYRFSIDALLLWHFARVKKRARVIDLGTGSGVIAVLLAKKHPTAEVVGIEIQQELFECAKKNVSLNHLEGRVEIVRLSVQHVRELFPPQSFDLALSNPPYGRSSAGRINPDTQKRHARHETLGRLEDFLSAAAYLIKPGAKTAFIFRASRLAELFAGMNRFGIEPKRLRLIHSRVDKEASMVLVEGMKRGSAGMTVLPPLFLYGPGRSYTDEVARILEGESL